MESNRIGARASLLALLTLLTLALASGCGAYVTLVHTVPAPVNIAPARSVAVVGTGDTADDPGGEDEAFLNLFLLRLERAAGDAFEVIDGRELARQVDAKVGVGDAATIAAFHQKSEAEVIARVSSPHVLTRCTVDLASEEHALRRGGSILRQFYEARCEAGLELYSAVDGHPIAALSAVGKGESQVDQDNAQDDALNDARNDAVMQLIDGFVPRRAVESADLDMRAPLAAEGLAKIESGDHNGQNGRDGQDDLDGQDGLAAARALWQQALVATPGSAPLLYNLGVVCEAQNDWQGAREYFSRASQAMPAEPLYQQALALLAGRSEDARLAAEGDPRQQAAEKAAAEAKTAALAAKGAADAAAAAAARQQDDQKLAAARARAQAMAAAALQDAASGLRFLLIPAGELTMGCTAGDAACGDDERPAHRVTIGKAFYLADTVTTNAQYQRCIDAGACAGKAEPQKSAHPVVGVTWSAAADFCDWAGGRLPTEAEWELAARGGTPGWRYPSGNELRQDEANYALSTKGNIEVKSVEASADAARIFGLTYPHQGTTPVGTYPANGFALFDMAGNVLQWVADWDGPYAPGPEVDPSGPHTGQYRILRGGSWAVTAEALRVSSRYSADPTTALDTLGFRCARDANAR